MLYTGSRQAVEVNSAMRANDHFLRIVLVTLLAVGMAAPHAFAADEAFEVSGQIGFVSDYVSRGLSQTQHRPALQAGVEISHLSGVYAGVWGSNISNTLYPGGSVETELYLGYDRKFNNDYTLRLEGIYYLYPGANNSKGVCYPVAACASQSFNTFIGRISVGRDWLTARVGYSFTNYFGDAAATGFPGGTRGTTYWELNANYPLPFAKDWKAVGHLGYTWYPSKFVLPYPPFSQNGNYLDWQLGITKELSGWAKNWKVGIAYAQANNVGGFDPYVNYQTTRLGRAAAILSIEHHF